MQKYFFNILILSIAALTFAACSKDKNDGTETILVKPHYPTITLNGNKFVSQSVGTGAYTDPGAVGYNDQTKTNENLTPIKNTVDLTTPGFYTVTYQFRNNDGYEVSATRFVLVTTVNASQNFSGLFQRNADPTRPANLSKIGTGLYLIDNVGGVILPTQAPAEPAYIGFTSDTTIQIPLQTTPDGTAVAATEGKSYITPTDTVMQWRMTAGPFSFSNTRVFYKVH